MNSHITGAPAMVVFHAPLGFLDPNVPVRKVKFVSGTSSEKSAVVKLNGVLIRSMVPLVSASYEKPTWTGWSMYSMLALSFHDQGLFSTDFESSRTLQGPFSPSAAVEEGTPGPPWSQTERGALWELLRASKNQNHMLLL